MTTASISPCLQIEPVNTWSPVLLVTGRDSPVRADCIVEGKPLGQINQADMLTQQTYQQLQPYCYMETLAANVNCVITWSTFTGSPSSRRASAGMISPSLMLTISPGTKIEASSSCHCPSLKTWRSHPCLNTARPDWNTTVFVYIQTFVFSARRDMRAAAALPALFSSMKLMIELITRRQTIPRKSSQSGPWLWTKR